VRWNPTLFYLETPPGFLVGAYWGLDRDAVGWVTFNVTLCLGAVALRIEKGIKPA